MVLAPQRERWGRHLGDHLLAYETVRLGLVFQATGLLETRGCDNQACVALWKSLPADVGGTSVEESSMTVSSTHA